MWAGAFLVLMVMCVCLCLQAGGCAGMCVDLTLFPLDTIKTRLQSQQGFYKAGGFRGIYAGVPSAAVGSFPNGETSSVAAGCNEGGSLVLNSERSNEGEREQPSLCFVLNHLKSVFVLPLFCSVSPPFIKWDWSSKCMNNRDLHCERS